MDLHDVAWILFAESAVVPEYLSYECQLSMMIGQNMRRIHDI